MYGYISTKFCFNLLLFSHNNITGIHIAIQGIAQ